MSEVRLEAKDLKKLKELIKVTESIGTLYQEMQDLEINGQKNSQKYQKLLDYLTIALDTENRLYNELLIDYDKVFSMVDYLDSEDEDVNIDAIIEDHSDGKVRSRIMKALLRETVISKRFANGLIPGMHKQLMKLLGLKEMEGLITDRILAMIDLDMALSRDVLVIYLAMLDEFITNPDYTEYLDVLTKTKYDIVFINRNIESEFLANDFVVSRTPDLSSELCANLNDIDYDMYGQLKNQFLSDAAIEQIEYLWDINDDDYEDDDIRANALLTQCLLRSIFTVLDDDIIDQINEEFHDVIESDEYMEEFPNYKISEKNIIDCFKRIKLDRGKIKVHS